MASSLVTQSSRSEPLGRRRSGPGLTLRIVCTFAGTIVFVGALVVAVVHYLMTEALRGQVNQRALAIATNLSDVAAGHVLAKNPLALHAQVTKYALLGDVAYALVADREGKVIAHSLGNLPPELREIPAGARSTTGQRDVTLRGRGVYETRVPLLEGQLGTVHVGIWADAVEEEIRRALGPLIGAIGIVFFAGVMIAVFVARAISRPIVRLTEVANNISKGDLDAAVGIQARGEIQELADSLERMRASLKAAMARLSRNLSQ
ncbi:MAG TPA: HAMP domain-containing protein [Candidatus Acidoferrales bacterium]|nr:HAMP domain-containing protein [Candidatus Acidoferrales bacterium]